MSFIKDDHSIAFDIDYILDGIEKGGPFTIVPSKLTFHNVRCYTVSHEYKGTMPEQIKNVQMSKIGKSPNGRFDVYAFKIETDGGYIGIEATGFDQNPKSSPVQSISIDLGRENATV